MSQDDNEEQETIVPVNDAVVETIQGDVTPLVTEYAEMGLDAALNEGVLRDIPVVGSLVAIGKVGMALRDRQFMKKLLTFLNALKEVSAEQRQAMIARLHDDPAYGRDVGEHLVDLFEKVDSERKPAMIAKIFAAYIEERIDATLLQRLIGAIERIPFYEIDAVRRVHVQSQAEGGVIEEPEHTMQALEGAGLMLAKSGWGAIVYQPSELCAVFTELDLDQTD